MTPIVTRPSLDSQLLQLNCLVLGEPRTRIFPVEIGSIKSVGNLKDAIKEKNQLAFQHVDADTLVLWKVSVPSHESVHENLDKLQVDFVDEKSLLPTDILSHVFSEPLALNHIHVIVKLPSRGESG